jgi:PIN domain nuclease of toxin-antitoxin system
MNLLLDTQVFLWFISADRRLPDAWKELIRDRANAVFLSVASVWEAVIKSQLGKLPLPEAAEMYLPRQRQQHLIASLPIDEGSLAHLAGLPSLHRDPFDRMLISQALQHDLVIMTADDLIRAYPVRVVAARTP